MKAKELVDTWLEYVFSPQEEKSPSYAGFMQAELVRFFNAAKHCDPTEFKAALAEGLKTYNLRERSERLGWQSIIEELDRIFPPQPQPQPLSWTQAIKQRMSPCCAIL